MPTGQPAFQANLQFFRTVRAETLSLVRALSQEQTDFSPAEGKWSVGEVLDHLLLSEQLYRKDFSELIELAKSGRQPLLRRSATEVNFSPGFLPKSWLPVMEVPFTVMNLFVPRGVQELMIRYTIIPGQNPDIAAPRKGRPRADLCRELASCAEQTAALLEAHPDLDYSSMVVQHPLMGSNNVIQLLRILALHEQRHQGQMADIRKSFGFPKAA